MVTFIASCSDDNLVVEEIEDPETVSRPVAPSVSREVLLDSLVTLVSGGAISSRGHKVEYQFDYGDGRRSAWLTDAVTAGSWSVSGRYDVRAQARCAQHIDIVSDWSTSTAVQAAPEQISPPVQPAGTLRLCAGSDGKYSSEDAVSNAGHPVEYQYDWGDGLSYWSGDIVQMHTWASPGAYDCRVRARCALDLSVISNWSPALAVDVVEGTPPWVLEFDLPSLVAFYGEKGSYQAHSAVVTYSGPQARITGFKVETTGRGAGTTCQFDGNPTPFNVSLIVWTRLRNDDDAWGVEVWPALFLGLPSSNWVDSGLWVYEGPDWTTPEILQDGEQLRVQIAPGLEGFSGCWANGFDFFELFGARLFLELECASESY